MTDEDRHEEDRHWKVEVDVEVEGVGWWIIACLTAAALTTGILALLGCFDA